MFEKAKKIYEKHLSRKFLKGIIVEGSPEVLSNSAVCNHCGITVYGYKKIAGYKKSKTRFEACFNRGKQPDGTWLFETKKEIDTVADFKCPRCGKKATYVLKSKPVVTREFITPKM